MTPEALCELADAFAGCTAAEVELGLPIVDVDVRSWVDGLRFARDELGCDFFDWLSAVDDSGTHETAEDDEFLIVAHLWSTSARHHLLVRTRIPKQQPVLPTAVGVYRGANWHEREAFEMFGITFAGHPNLIPLLLPDGFEGNPLRKDFVLASRVAKQWPGLVEPGQSADEVTNRGQRKKKLPPGVPAPEDWGPTAEHGDPP